MAYNPAPQLGRVPDAFGDKLEYSNPVRLFLGVDLSEFDSNRKRGRIGTGLTAVQPIGIMPQICQRPRNR